MSTIYKDKNITKMYYGSKPVYSFSVEDGGGTGGDTTTYSYKTPTADVEGLKALGWDDESIGYFRDNNLCYDWQKDNYIVTEGNKELYGVVTKDNKSTYKSDPNFVYCPMFETNTDTYMVGMFENFKYLRTIPKIDTSKQKRLSKFFKNCSSLTTIPKLETGNANEMIQFFYKCSSLVVVPNLDTSKATSFSSFFYNCSSLTTIPKINTSSATYLADMFNGCSSLTTIPEINTSNATNMTRMFSGCAKLQSIPLLDTTNVTSMYSMFSLCASLQSIPELNTSNVTSMDSMFYSCTSLQSIPLLDCGKVTNMNTFFSYSTINTLTDLGGFKDLKISVTSYFLDKAPNLTIESLMNVINNLYDLTGNGLSGQSLKIGSTNLNKLTGEQIAVATAKGWTLTA